MRMICEIAQEIEQKWPNVWYGARPYLDAMKEISKPTDIYIAEDGKAIVLYFLANSQTWKGEDARRIKKELRDLIKREENDT